jgi:chromate transporter
MLIDDPMNTLTAADRPQPESLRDLFVSFTLLALQGFGGVMPVVQREMVERKRWLTKEEFVEDWSVAQIMPGPNVVNLTLIVGGRYFGIAGALTALAGLVLAPLVVALMLALVYTQVADHAGVAGALRGIGAVVAGMFAATGLKLCSALTKNPLGIPLCIGLGVTCFVMVAILRWPLFFALLGPGMTACILAYRRLKP